MLNVVKTWYYRFLWCLKWNERRATKEWCGLAQGSACVYPDCGGLKKVDCLLIELRPYD